MKKVIMTVLSLCLIIFYFTYISYYSIDVKNYEIINTKIDQEVKIAMIADVMIIIVVLKIERGWLSVSENCKRFIGGADGNRSDKGDKTGILRKTGLPVLRVHAGSRWRNAPAGKNPVRRRDAPAPGGGESAMRADGLGRK